MADPCVNTHTERKGTGRVDRDWFWTGPWSAFVFRFFGFSGPKTREAGPLLFCWCFPCYTHDPRQKTVFKPGSALVSSPDCSASAVATLARALIEFCCFAKLRDIWFLFNQPAAASRLPLKTPVD